MTRTPRIILGDSPGLCLKYARHALARAKRAARVGDVREAGRWLAEAGETGMLPVLDGPMPAFDSSRSLRLTRKAYAQSRALGCIGEL